MLKEEIQSEYSRLVKIVAACPDRNLRVIDGTGGKVSVADLIAYQIGWGKALIRWYEAGKRSKMPEMPGDGFTKWNYEAIALFFYQKYHFDGLKEQMGVFQEVVLRILEIVEEEKDQMDEIGVWAWCTLPSGKQWPLSKWIRVNTVSPYKRAVQLIKKAKQC